MEKKFSETFREVRKNRGWTLEQVAQKIGVTHSYLSQVERGNKEPSDIVLRAMRRLVDPTFLMDDDGLELSPLLNDREVRLVRAYRKLPRSFQNHYVEVLEHFSS